VEDDEGVLKREDMVDAASESIPVVVGEALSLCESMVDDEDVCEADEDERGRS